MKCAEVMKRDVKCLADEDTVQHAARVMRDYNIGFLPVCDADGRVLGTITDRDIAIRICADDLQASAMPISNLRSSDVIACRPDDDLSYAEQLMANYQKSRLVVVDDRGFIQGVISLSDIAERDDFEASAWTLRRVAAREARPD